MNYWLMKSEPDAFGIDDLKARPKQTEPWDGIRNYQARNFMRDAMQPGDLALFYHSNCKPPGIVGIMEIVSAAYPDPTQFDAGSKYFDAKSDPDNPRWLLVDVRFQRDFRRMVTLEELKAAADRLGDFPLVRRGNRLSILPVTEAQWKVILELEQIDPEPQEPA
ncbi:MAG: EVE domain-containing protein [Wenzhouxiangellaceae bacterium]|nr:EVE domain-containing protein [Wenzhouxiangellaceae bacterium]